VTVRPAVEVVHPARNGQPAQAAPKRAVPAPSSSRRIGVVTALGQVTVSRSRSMWKRSLVNSPPGRGAGGWVLHPESMPCSSRVDWNSPLPYAQSPNTLHDSAPPARSVVDSVVPDSVVAGSAVADSVVAGSAVAGCSVVDSPVVPARSVPESSVSGRAGCSVWIGSSEAHYQACRFPDHLDIQKEIIAAPHAFAAKLVSRKGGRRERFTRPDWDVVRVDVMRWCLAVKLACNCEEFTRLLQSTGERPIVERSRRDDFWGAKLVGKVLVGTNTLGQLLMELRTRVRRAENDDDLKVVEPPPIENFRLMGQIIESLNVRASGILRRAM